MKALALLILVPSITLAGTVTTTGKPPTKYADDGSPITATP